MLVAVLSIAHHLLTPNGTIRSGLDAKLPREGFPPGDLVGVEARHVLSQQSFERRRIVGVVEHRAGERLALAAILFGDRKGRTAPGPRRPPSSQLVPSTVSSIAERTAPTFQPVTRAIPLISPSRGRRPDSSTIKATDRRRGR
jgi:hypothetical protein